MKPQAPVNADFAAGGHQNNRTLLGSSFLSFFSLDAISETVLIAANALAMVLTGSIFDPPRLIPGLRFN
jgi:hypothetical protein